MSWHIVVEIDNVARYVIAYDDGSPETYSALDVSLLSEQTMTDVGVSSVEQMLNVLGIENGLSDDALAITR